MNISINFLPTERKKEIKNLKYIGVVMRVGLMAVLALGLFVFFLKASIYVISVEKDVVEAEILRFENSDFYRQTKIAQDSLREYNKTAKTIENGLKTKKDYSTLIAQLNQMIPEGIILNNFSLTAQEVVLGGVALERTALLLLEQRLKEEKGFKEVDSPISNFVSDTNAKFTFAIKLK